MAGFAGLHGVGMPDHDGASAARSSRHLYSTSKPFRTSPACARFSALPAEMADRDVAEIAFQRRRAQTGNDFLQLHLQRVVAISCALREAPGSRCGRWVRRRTAKRS